MKSILILPHIKVEGANAVSGFLYGFPAITHFLGYVHAISRELERDSRLRVKLGGCGIICHNHRIHSYKTGSGGEHMFSLTKNPLTKEGKTAAFNEEGKLQIEVSLIIECDFTSDNFDFSTGDNDADKDKFTEFVFQLAITKHLAGGIITKMSPVEFHEISQIEEKAQAQCRRLILKMLPGFALCDRSTVFEEYLSNNPELKPLDALLDFYTLKSRAIQSIQDAKIGTFKATWERIPKPILGWIVPIQAGYKAISPVYYNGEVSSSRDPSTPFRFVEPIYSLGEWVGAHRIYDMDSIFWRYQNDNIFYLCQNNNKK